VEKFSEKDISVFKIFVG